MYIRINQEEENMKKQYNAPVAEKMVFDYEENVVASGFDTSVTTNGPQNGNPWVGNKGNKPGCTKIEKC